MGTKYLDIDGFELTEAEYMVLQEKGLKKKVGANNHSPLPKDKQKEDNKG